MEKIVCNLIVAIVISYLFHLLLHETGHMIGGYLSGWKLIYLQLFQLLITKEKGKLIIKWVDHSTFQCIMYPKDKKTNPFLYTMMGCYFNLCGTCAGMILLFLMHDKIIISIYATAFLIVGLLCFLMNYIPGTKRICNDGACDRLLQSDQLTRESHNQQLMAAKKLHNGICYRDIKEEYICLAGGYAGNDITAYQAILEYYYFLDREEYEAAHKALVKIDKRNELSKNILDIVLLEQLYLELINHIQNPQLSPPDVTRYGGSISGYILKHGCKGDVHTERIRMAGTVYEMLQAGKKNEALKLIQIAKENIKDTRCIYEGEKIFNLEQMRRINNNINENYQIRHFKDGSYNIKYVC